MSKFKEYLKLVKDGFPNIDKIAEGVLNQVKSRYGYLPLEDQEEIARRQLICSTCPLFPLMLKKMILSTKNLWVYLLRQIGKMKNSVEFVAAQ